MVHVCGVQCLWIFQIQSGGWVYLLKYNSESLICQLLKYIKKIQYSIPWKICTLKGGTLNIFIKHIDCQEFKYIVIDDGVMVIPRVFCND